MRCEQRVVAVYRALSLVSVPGSMSEKVNVNNFNSISIESVAVNGLFLFFSKLET